MNIFCFDAFNILHLIKAERIEKCNNAFNVISSNDLLKLKFNAWKRLFDILKLS